MKPVVDLSIFHEMTGSDLVLERKLFKVFFESSTQCLAIMQANWHRNGEQAWRQQAHAFKGLCLNIGAGHLAQLCEKAQNCDAEKPEKKLKLLKSIQNEFGQVRQYLEKI